MASEAAAVARLLRARNARNAKINVFNFVAGEMK
jgi:hypothetical protein